MKIILMPNPYRDKGLKAAKAALRILSCSRVECRLCLPFQPDNRLELPSGLDFHKLEDEIVGADMLICFGGDGTLLHTAKTASVHDIPIMGINMGSVGFMAELEHGELELLSRIPAGKYTEERRMMLDVRAFHEGQEIYSDTALNDAAITKGAVARIIELDIFSDKTAIGRSSGDGLVVSTPTGSTAYSMAAGGPIVEPEAENIIITPLCTHSLGSRSFVLNRNRVVCVKLPRNMRKTAYLSVDGGRAVRLTAGDSVSLSRSDRVTRLVRLTSRSFYHVISQKLTRPQSLC